MEVCYQDFKASDLDLWTQHIPLPRILDVVAQVLESCREDDALPTDILEDLLPHLCFALPRNAKACSRVLRSLPPNSSVWDKLEEGLSAKKYLPVEITATLYEERPSALEGEMLRVLDQYVERSDETSPGAARLELQPLDAGLSAEPKMMGCRYVDVQSEGRKNFWSGSPAVPAANRGHSLFSMCFEFLCQVVVRSNFSVTSVIGSRDFFAEMLDLMNGELYKVFPTHMQHLVYLLTLPVTSGQGTKFFENGAQLSVVEDAVFKALQEDTTTLCILLCFFPYWLPILEQNQLMDKFLRQRCKFPYIS